ncbi:MAG: hypothetical protein H7Z72_04395 [Bacteroidetes bacterium]|nr:hypothetical protein [Fibrella sp.]
MKLNIQNKTMASPENNFIEDIFQENMKNVLGYLKTGGSINFVDERDSTPLLTAIETDSYELVKLLLDAGANPNLATDYASPLTSAIDVSMEAYKNDGLPQPSTAIIELLLFHGADIHMPNNKGRNPYEFAKNYHLPAHKLFDSLERGG